MEFKKITEDRYNEVIIHLRDNFFPDEPLNKAAGLCSKGENNAALEDISLKTLKENLSLMAVNESDEIVACVLNGVLRPGDIEESVRNLELVNDENFRKIFKLIYSLNLKANVFNYFDVDRVMDCRILSVDHAYRGQGIAQKLAEITEDLGRNCNFKLLKADATGAYSAKVLKRHGFTPLTEIYYDKYLDENGEQILKVEPPHVKIQLFCKVLE